MKDELTERMKGRRLLIGVKEAGAGSLLAALTAQWRPQADSLVLATPIAASYFAGVPVRLQIVDDSKGPGSVALAATIRDHRAEMIVTGASTGGSIEKDLLVAGNSAGVPVHAFVDHYWNLWQRFADERTAEKWRYLPERIYVPDPRCRDRMRSQGCAAERIGVYQHPLLDGTATGRLSGDGRPARQALAVDDDATMILFVSEYGFPPSSLWQWDQPPDSDVEALLVAVLEAALKLADRAGVKATVLVKMHPAERHGWEHVLGRYPADLYRLIRNHDKQQLFAMTDIAFGLNSMMLLEAAQRGVPTYSWHASGAGRDAWLSAIRCEITELNRRADVHAVIASAAREVAVKHRQYGAQAQQ